MTIQTTSKSVDLFRKDEVLKVTQKIAGEQLIFHSTVLTIIVYTIITEKTNFGHIVVCIETNLFSMN